MIAHDGIEQTFSVNIKRLVVENNLTRAETITDSMRMESQMGIMPNT